MKANDIIFQAEKFLRWHSRAGGDLEDNFKWWARSKEFWPDDERAVWGVIQEFLARVDASTKVVPAA